MKTTYSKNVIYRIADQSIKDTLKKMQIFVDGNKACRHLHAESKERKALIAEMLRKKQLTYKTLRDNYNAIIVDSLRPATQKQVFNLIRLAQKAEKIDEHGGWEFGCEFDDKGRGNALSWDLYAIGRDTHNRKTLIVVQIRQWVKKHKNGFANIKKSYFLIGRNEDNTVFAHAVEARVVHSAIKNSVDIIKAVQSWIFGCDYDKVLRQGDIAMIPVSRVNVSAVKLDTTTHILESTHVLTAHEIFKNADLYASNPVLKHLPATHPVVAAEGLYKIVVGKRALHHDFAAPTID